MMVSNGGDCYIVWGQAKDQSWQILKRTLALESTHLLVRLKMDLNITLGLKPKVHLGGMPGMFLDLGSIHPRETHFQQSPSQ